MAKKKVKSKKRAVGKTKYTAAKSKAVKKKTRPAKTVSKAKKVAKKATPLVRKKAKAKVLSKAKSAPKKVAKRKTSKPQSVAPVPTPQVAEPPETLEHDSIVEPTVTSNVETSAA